MNKRIIYNYLTYGILGACLGLLARIGLGLLYGTHLYDVAPDEQNLNNW
jgi:hypothetical protein